MMLTIAHIETGGKFHNPNYPNSKYAGVYQLASGYGGCVGDARLDVTKATKCTWSRLEHYKKNLISEFGANQFQDYWLYMAHQQGLAGFKYLWRNKNQRISSIKEARRKAIYSNAPKSVNLVYVSDFLSYWKNRFNSLMKKYEDYSTTEKAMKKMELTVPQLQAEIAKEKTKIQKHDRNKKILFIAVPAAATATGIYLYKKYKK